MTGVQTCALPILDALDTLYKKMFKPEHYAQSVSLAMMEESQEKGGFEGV